MPRLSLRRPMLKRRSMPLRRSSPFQIPDISSGMGASLSAHCAPAPWIDIVRAFYIPLAAPCSQLELDLTRFGGHLILWEKGVPDGKDPSPVPARVSPPDGGARAVGSKPRATRSGSPHTSHHSSPGANPRPKTTPFTKRFLLPPSQLRCHHHQKHGLQAGAHEVEHDLCCCALRQEKKTRGVPDRIHADTPAAGRKRRSCRTGSFMTWIPEKVFSADPCRKSRSKFVTFRTCADCAGSVP